MSKHLLCTLVLLAVLMSASSQRSSAQIPLERVLKKTTIPSEKDQRGLVDIVGFPQTAEQIDYIGKSSEEHERIKIQDNQRKFNLDENTAFVCGVSPHDDYALAAYDYVHVHRYIKARTVILIGNAHWSEAFGIRNKLIFCDFGRWRGPYGPVKVSRLRDEILMKLESNSYTVNRSLAETEHSLEAQIPFLQYYNRNVEIIPIFIPFTDWNTMQKLGRELAGAVAEIMKQNSWKLGEDIAILCSTDGQHYGDYGWSYYDYHPFGCNADGYKKATELDNNLLDEYLTGVITSEKVHGFFSSLVDQSDISQYKITWCGRFAVSFGINFAMLLAQIAENRQLTGHLLRYGTSISDEWLPLSQFKLGLTGDANLHHFVTYAALGFR